MGVDGIVVYFLLFRNFSFQVEVRTTTTTVQSNSTQFFSPDERGVGGGIRIRKFRNV